MGSPIALIGAAIKELSVDRTFMRYREVCIKCGYLGSEITTHGPQGSNASFGLILGAQHAAIIKLLNLEALNLRDRREFYY